MSERPLSQELVLILGGSGNHVGDNRPRRDVVQPLVAPCVEAGPVRDGTATPDREGSVVQHDSLSEIVCRFDVIGSRERHTKVLPR